MKQSSNHRLPRIFILYVIYLVWFLADITGNIYRRQDGALDINFNLSHHELSE